MMVVERTGKVAWGFFAHLIFEYTNSPSLPKIEAPGISNICNHNTIDRYQKVEK